MKKTLFGCGLGLFLVTISGCSLFDSSENISKKTEEKSEFACDNVTEAVEKGKIEACTASGFDEESVSYCNEMIMANQFIEAMDSDSCNTITDESIKKYCNEYIVYNDNTAKITPIILKSIENFQNGNFDEALKQQDQALTENPDDIDIKIIKAKTLIGKGSVTFEEEKYAKDALKILEEVLTENPNHVEALYAKGYAYEIQNMFDEAIKSYQKSLEIDPENIKAINQIGHVYDLQGKRTESIKYYEKASTLNKQNSHVLINLARNYIANNDLQKAQDTLTESLKINELSGELSKRSKAEVYSLMASIALLLNQDYNAAFNNYEKAIEIDPEYPNALVGYGWTSFYNLVATQDPEKWTTTEDQKVVSAIEYIEKAIEINPEQTIAYMYKARILTTIGDLEEAEKIINKGIETLDKDISLMGDEKLKLKESLEIDLKNINDQKIKFRTILYNKINLIF